MLTNLTARRLRSFEPESDDLPRQTPRDSPFWNHVSGQVLRQIEIKKQAYCCVGFQYLLVMRLFALPSGPASPPGTLLVAIKHLGVSTPTVIHAR
jgi:hypothetical protein